MNDNIQKIHDALGVMLANVERKGILEVAQVDVQVGFHERIDVDVRVLYDPKTGAVTVSQKEGLSMTKEQLVAFLTKIQNVVRTLSTFLPPLAVVATAIDAILGSDMLLNVVLWMVNRFFTAKIDEMNAFAEEELFLKVCECAENDLSIDAALKAKLKTEVPQLKLKLKASK